MLRRTEKDVNIQLPKMQFSTLMVERRPFHLAEVQEWARTIISTSYQNEFMDEIRQEQRILEDIFESNATNPDLIAILKARAKSISTLRIFMSMEKLNAACEVIADELENRVYEKVVIFGIHRAVILGAMARLQKFHPISLWGGTPALKREKHIMRFQSSLSKNRVLIANILAAGTSICLDRAHHIFFLEEDWVPGNNAQAAMRCSGPNQKKQVIVRNFCSDDPIDQRIQDTLRRKIQEQCFLFETEKVKTMDKGAVGVRYGRPPSEAALKQVLAKTKNIKDLF